MTTYETPKGTVTVMSWDEYERKKKMRIDYKPLSVNECWKGRRFKTDEYKRYERDLLFLLPKYQLPPKPFAVGLNFGLSNLSADIDNPVKPFLDILQKKYGFNDRDIMALKICKIKTEKGKEFINFTIEHIEI